MSAYLRCEMLERCWECYRAHDRAGRRGEREVFEWVVSAAADYTLWMSGWSQFPALLGLDEKEPCTARIKESRSI